MPVSRQWRNRRQREKALRAAFVRMLVRAPVKSVRFSKGGRRVSLAFLGERVACDVLVKREVYVGHWRRKSGIDIDKEMFSKKRMRSFKALCVHEAIEKFLVERYGLKLDEEAHAVATAKEKQYLKRIGGNWKSHQMTVYHLWSKLDGH